MVSGKPIEKGPLVGSRVRPLAGLLSLLDGPSLEAFLAFASTLNFTKAAKEVGLSQPAFFERIKKVEEALGMPLYRKAGRSLELTEQGMRFAAYVRETAQRAAEVLSDLRMAATTQEVVLAAGEGAYLYLLGPALTLFARLGGRLRPLTLGGPAACQALLSGEAHLAVAAVDLVPAHLDSEVLLVTPQCIAVHAGHRLADQAEVTLADLAGERLILAPEGQSHRVHVGRALMKGGQAGQPGQGAQGGLFSSAAEVIEADGWPLMLRFAQLGLGVAFVNGSCHVPSGVVLRPLPELGSICYRLLVRQGARGRLPQVAQDLAEAIRGTLCPKAL